jgi:hypothetical protein
MFRGIKGSPPIQCSPIPLVGGGERGGRIYNNGLAVPVADGFGRRGKRQPLHRRQERRIRKVICTYIRLNIYCEEISRYLKFMYAFPKGSCGILTNRSSQTPMTFSDGTADSRERGTYANGPKKTAFFPKLTFNLLVFSKFTLGANFKSLICHLPARGNRQRVMRSGRPYLFRHARNDATHDTDDEGSFVGDAEMTVIPLPAQMNRQG